MPRSDHTPRLDTRLGDGLYWDQSRLPLQILVFLLPLIIAYEIGLAWVLRRDGDVLTNLAHLAILQFFDSFGIGLAAGGLLLGGVVVIVVLLAWHVLAHERWQWSARVAALMYVEATLLALPLLVIGQSIQYLAQSGTPLTATVLASTQHVGAASFGDLSFVAGVAIAIGAGIYEELVFRWMLIAIVHTILVDIARASHAIGATVGVVVSAAAFAFYHPLRDASGAIVPLRLVFYVAAGLYFGLVYVVRGFGLVVGVHAIYDIIAIALTAANE